MKPKEPATRPQSDLFRMELQNLIDSRHELARLAEMIDWEAIAAHFGELYIGRKGRPGIPTRLMAGLLYLKATFKLSDEEVVRRWVEVVSNFFRTFQLGVVPVFAQAAE